MAFSPFRAFRKHQKAMFAALAVLSMFIFVLTGSMSAGWDFFNGITQYFGGSSKYPVVATVYGKRIDTQEVQRLRYNRQIANYYMAEAVQRAYVNSYLKARSLEMQLEKDYPEISRQLNLFTQSATNAEQYQQLAAMALGNPELVKKAEGRSLAEQMVQARSLSFALGRKLGQLRGKLYFGGTLEAEDLVNFVIWQHQATVRGIQYTKDDIQTLINKDTLDLLTDADVKFVDGQLSQRYGRLKWSDLLTALADEFRVREAKEALGYAEPGSEGLPDPTPFEFWEFYRENRASARLALAGIPALSPAFLAKIGKPTEQELHDLYEKYKNQNYVPQSPAPGFRQPPQIRVQWVRPQLEHFRAQATLASRSLDAAMQVAGAGLAGAQPWDVLLPQAVDLRLLSQYEEAKNSRFRAPALTSADFALSYYPGTDDPGNIAGAVGQAFGVSGSFAPAAALSGLLAYQAGGVARQSPDTQAALQEQTQKRLQLGVKLILAGAGQVRGSDQGPVRQLPARQSGRPGGCDGRR